MARRVLLSFLLLLPAAAAVVAGLRERSEADVRARVMRAIEAESTVSYRATRTVQFGATPIKLTLVHQAPDRTRIERMEGEGRHGDHGPRGERPDHGPRGEHGDRGHGHRGGGGGGGPWRAVPILDVDLALRSYDTAVDGPTVRFTSRHPGRPTLSMTFDDANGLLLGWEYALPGGAGTYRVATESLDLTTPISIEEPARGRPRTRDREGDREGWRGEEFNPDVDRAPNGFPLLLPRALPEGFRRIEARLVRRGDRASARLAWTDGIAVVSIFEFEAGAPGGRWAIEELPRPEAGKVVVERRGQEGTSFLRGRVADTGFVVMGSLGEAELTELISSLEFGSVDKEAVR